jgi:hypothetical protein
VTGAERLAAALRDEGGLLAAALAPEPPADDPELAAADGPAGDHALVLAAVREGYLLHYGAGALVRLDDPDLALLGGDRLYALGLARLAEIGDLEAVGQLAELISRCAQAHAEDDPESAREAWRALTPSFGR